VQDRLRNELKTAYTDAHAEQRRPTAEEIAKIHIHYLDAVIEEIVRKSITAGGVTRQAMEDTTLLGHRIPKGTTVFLLNNGPGIQSAPIPADEAARSASSRAAKGKVGSWDPRDVGEFRPERWLARGEGGQHDVYDSTAGPHIGFGLGPRGCFGKRLAYLQLRLFVVMIVWEYALQRCPEALSSYDARDVLTHQAVQCYVKLVKV
jgi:cytochrome P450